jgi:hypothetical protein
MEGAVHDLHPAEVEAFAHTWRAIAQACERGLTDPAYPTDRRPALYELLGAARECAEPGALQRVRRARRPTAR